MQGLNIAVLDGASAIAPFAYGVLADSHGIVVCLWTAAGISMVAALINSPLIFNARLRKSPEDDNESCVNDKESCVDDKKIEATRRLDTGSTELFYCSSFASESSDQDDIIYEC